VYSEWSEFGGGSGIDAILPNPTLVKRTIDMLKMNNLGRLRELSGHYKQMASKADHRVANILNELSGHLETYANTESPESRSEIIDCRNRIEKTRQTGDPRYLQKGYVPQKNSGNNNPRANWQVRRGQRAVGESWSMNLDEE
jgi:hypothetical protein